MPIRERQPLFLYTDLPPAGYSDFSFRPNEAATFAYVAKYLFKGLGLPVKRDYTDLWKIMPSKNPKFTTHPSTHHCTPDQWATYYIMILRNMGAFAQCTLWAFCSRPGGSER